MMDFFQRCMLHYLTVAIVLGGCGILSSDDEQLQSGNALDIYEWLDGKRIPLQVSEDKFVVLVPDSQYHEIADLDILQNLPERNRYPSYNKQVKWVTETSPDQMEVIRHIYNQQSIY